MSTLRVDTITDEAGTGPVEFANGINVSGGTVTGIDPFKYTAVSGATQALDVGSHNFFDAGTLTADTTVSFSNVPTEARWTYTAEIGVTSSYDIAGASYDGGSADISIDSDPLYAVFFSPDGTKMYTAGVDYYIRQYNLSTPWSLGTASGVVRSYRFNIDARRTQGIFFSPDGTKLYAIGDVYDYVTENNLSTPWDISTASHVSSFSVAGQDGTPTSLSFSSDGTKMYMVGNANNRIYQYALSTPWSISTASLSTSFAVNSQNLDPSGVFFNPDGTKMYLIGFNPDRVSQYSLSTAWAVNTASYDSVLFSVSQDTSPQDVFLSPDGTKMYILGGTNQKVFQYSIGGVSAITIPSAVQNPPTEFLNSGDQISYTFFTADGGTTVKLINEEVL